MIPQTEIDRLHRLATSGVRAGRFRIDDLGRLLTLLTSFSVEGVHLLLIVRRRSRRIPESLGHRAPPIEPSDDQKAHASPRSSALGKMI
jgi:hypothetical protein